MAQASADAASAQPDYFSVFGLPRRLRLDASALESEYHRLSREVHPDFHMTKPPDERERLLARSALVNAAYRTLRDFHARVEYLVGLEGGDELKPVAPPALLEEVLEVQELLEECRAEAPVKADGELGTRLEEEHTRLRGALDDLDRELSDGASAWDQTTDDDKGRVVRRETLARLRELLSQRVYIVNLIRDIEEIKGSGG